MILRTRRPQELDDNCLNDLLANTTKDLIDRLNRTRALILVSYRIKSNQGFLGRHSKYQLFKYTVSEQRTIQIVSIN